jgi:hypothetical protein
MNGMHFTDLEERLRVRTARAILSQMAPRSSALRARLMADLTREPGSGGGALIGDPVFESLFDWESSGKRLSEIPEIRPDVAEALARPYRTPRRGHEFEALFPAAHFAHRHQLRVGRRRSFH